jgi:hypothetical protein
MKMRIVLIIAVLFAASASAWATPIPGSSNELLNPNFESSPIIGYDARGFPIYGSEPWVLGRWISVGLDGPDHHLAANCKNDLDPPGLWMFQIVDETRNPLWDPYGTQKIVDLMADIRVVGDHTWSTVKFKLGYWDTNYPTMPIVPIQDELPIFPTSGFQWTPTAQYGFTEIGTWYTVNPFNQITLPIQPRWLVVFVEFNQAPGEVLWVDDLVLTAKCIPEPSSMIALVVGLTSIAGCRRLRRK